jgi:hypothetical protein
MTQQQLSIDAALTPGLPESKRDVHPRSFPNLTPKDHLTAQKWNWRLALVCGTVLLFLVFIVAAGPYTRTETANIEHGFSAANMIGFPP